jgi:choline dehydrogenase
MTGYSDQLKAAVVYPFGTGLISGIYDWNIFTVPQYQFNGATRAVPVGHVVGGGTVINGMVWNRGKVDDFNTWDSLQGGSSGWSWNE